MPEPTSSIPTLPPSSGLSERLELANQLYREYHTRCFWHCPHDLEITEALIPLVVKGLRTYGGRRGFLRASALRNEGPVPNTRETPECR